MGSLYDDSPELLGRGIPLPIPHFPRRLRNLTVDVFGVEAVTSACIEHDNYLVIVTRHFLRYRAEKHMIDKRVYVQTNVDAPRLYGWHIAMPYRNLFLPVVLTAL